jgi:kynurenine formamidase
MKTIDLTLELYEGMPTFPVSWYPSPKMEFILNPGNDPSNAHRYASKSQLFGHGGTHLDSPMHYNYWPNEKTIDKVPVDVLVGDCVVVDMYDKKFLEEITAKELEQSTRGFELKGKRLVIRTGYTDKYWGKNDYFQVSPYLTADAAGWIVKQGIVLVGLDFQTDKPGDGTFPAHNVLLSNEVYILEYLVNVFALPRQCTLVVAPLKLKGMEASTCRVFALCSE